MELDGTHQLPIICAQMLGMSAWPPAAPHRTPHPEGVGLQVPRFNMT